MRGLEVPVTLLDGRTVIQPRIINDHVVWEVPDGAVVQGLLGLKTAGNYVAVPHDLPTVRFFANQGVKIPNPIETKYNWPGRFKPLEHQKATASFLVENKRAHLLSSMGVMKTASALWATDYLMRAGEVQRCIVFAPLSTLDSVWANEIFQVLPHRRAHIVYGSRDRRLSLLADKGVEFYITNHDALAILHDALKGRPDINHVIIDESACMRSAQTKRFRLAFSVLNRQGIERSCWGLTGTPTPTAPTDCYGQIRLITPERYKGSFKAIQNELMYQVSQFRWVPRTGAANRVHELMQPSIRFTLEDCSDLPETIWQERECELSPEQAKAYKEMKATAMTEIAGEQVTAVNAAVLLGKLLQASLGIMYGADGKVLEMDFGPRLQVIEEVIEESDAKVIIFVPFTGALNALYDKLKKKWSVEIVDGSVSSGKRNQIFRDFKEKPDPHILLAHPGTMAHGLTLTVASTIVWAAPVTSNETFLQANARIARPGQTKVTNIVMIHGSPAERGLYRTLKERGRMQDLLLSLARGGG